MPLSTDEHYLDSNVVIECCRTGCWKALAGNYALVTVDKVIEECGTGRHDTVDVAEIRRGVQVTPVRTLDLVRLKLGLRGLVNLDPGEEHLLAGATARLGTWRICSPDMALVRACWVMEYLDRVVSLESLLKSIGHTPKQPLKYQYTEKWLSEKRTALLLGTG